MTRYTNRQYNTERTANRRQVPRSWRYPIASGLVVCRRVDLEQMYDGGRTTSAVQLQPVQNTKRGGEGGFTMEGPIMRWDVSGANQSVAYPSI